MELSEMFLMIWAVIATVLACYFSYHAGMRGKLLVVLTMGIRDIARGKAEVYMEKDEVRIRKKEKDNENLCRRYTFLFS